MHFHILLVLIANGDSRKVEQGAVGQVRRGDDVVGLIRWK
jgi:hypothetical protein